jgi:hypothetical protein
VQDDLRATSNLTLNLGLRYEFTTDWNEANGRGTALRDVRRDDRFTPGLAFENPSLRNISPRFGFAWDVRGDGQTAVRGGFGLLYDVAVYAQQVGNISVASLPFSSQSAITTPGTFAVPLFFPESARGRAVRSMEYDQRNPHMLTYNFAVERQLPADMSLPWPTQARADSISRTATTGIRRSTKSAMELLLAVGRRGGSTSAQPRLDHHPIPCHQQEFLVQLSPVCTQQTAQQGLAVPELLHLGENAG